MPSRKATPANESKAGNGQLPKGWRMVRFDEIAESINDRVDPAETDLEVYVGLEHLDPESLKIRRWGTPDDVKGQKLKFRTGDIIFGKRRAYQRKLAVAECDGICSAHAMVLRPKTDAVDPDFLPFFMQSDLFMTCAIGISVGSLSPTINWKTLRIQEFPFPPVTTQSNIAQLLYSINQVVQRRREALTALIDLRRAVMDHTLTGAIGHASVRQFHLSESQNGWNIVTVSEISRVIRGSSPRPKGDPRFYGGTIPRVMVADITRDMKHVTPCIDFLTESGAEKSRPVPAGTLVVVCSGTKAAVGLPGILAIDACIHDGIIGLVEIDARCHPDWLYYLFTFFQTFLDAAATHGGTFVNLTTDIVKGIQIAVPPLNTQMKFIDRMREIDECVSQTAAQIHRDSALLTRVGHSLLTGNT